MADFEDALTWLIEQGWADPQRIGIMGFSYGGYAAAYALTHSTMFKVGIAGRWWRIGGITTRVYAERYMQTPDHNPQGYARASVTNAAGDLHGRLLIIHGLLDDNVHFQSCAQFIDALQQAGQTFDLMVYPPRPARPSATAACIFRNCSAITYSEISDALPRIRRSVRSAGIT